MGVEQSIGIVAVVGDLALVVQWRGNSRHMMIFTRGEVGSRLNQVRKGARRRYFCRGVGSVRWAESRVAGHSGHGGVGRSRGRGLCPFFVGDRLSKRDNVFPPKPSLHMWHVQSALTRSKAVDRPQNEIKVVL